MGHALSTGQIDRVLRMVVDLQWALVGAGRFDEATRLLDRALEQPGDAPPGLVGHATAIRAFICYYAGDLEGMQRFGRQGLKLSRAGSDVPGEITATLMLSLTGEAVSVDRAAELAEQYGDRNFRAFVQYTRALLAQLAGQLREAQRLYESMLAVMEQASEWGVAQAVIGLAQLAHARGDLAGAVAHYEHAQRLLHALDYRGDRIRCLTGLGKIAVELGDFDTARARLAESLSLSTGLGRRANAVDLVEAFTDLARRQGDQRRAVRLAAASTALRDRMGGAPAGGAGARTEDILAPARRELGDAVVASLWREGLELPWNRTIEYAVSGSLAVSAPTAVQVAPAPDSTLTDREREIVVLIARGLSNRALAEELVISPATVARHVSNILGKLGFTSRTQVAAWAVEHGMNE
ncbi:LuxR C-terminal-related transcriptional regulator [Nonomuraea sediminis]|uniref:LuxR C-terminal-related transcriptional regulator n=1 Tax=Nonomuraea sediminis TaxID=2835864 RepID=UPI001BDBF0FA|nr:LuxR C-terminal-related transcriptional regulator [Nonomuraea sediminis]